jgi:hypothetical protein
MAVQHAGLPAGAQERVCEWPVETTTATRAGGRLIAAWFTRRRSLCVRLGLPLEADTDEDLGVILVHGAEVIAVVRFEPEVRF